MKITKERFKKILLEEHERLKQSLNQDQQRATEERKLAHILHVFLSEARGKFEEYLGHLPEGEKPSEECSELFDAVADMWRRADEVLTGGERPKWLREPSEEEKPFFGHNKLQEEMGAGCTDQDLANALDVISRCVMGGETTQPPAEIGRTRIMPDPVVPAAGKTYPGIKFVDEDKKK